jgi:hypothetical protein
MKKFTTITGLSDSTRMPRLGKIRLGAKLEKVTGSGQNEKNVNFPIELPFFLLPDDVADVHGGKIPDPAARAREMGASRADVLKFINEHASHLAEELPVMIPVEETEYSFPQSYKLYGSGAGLKCNGNGVDASERIGITNEWRDRKCPCDQLKTDQNPRGGCTQVANLQVILPEVAMGGVYQIDIGSTNSIIDINSGIKYTRSIYLKATGEPRVAMVPLTLRRVATETHHGGKKQIHFTCQLTPVGTIKTFTQLAESSKMMLTHAEALALPEPELTNPVLDEVDAVYEQPKHITIKIDELNKLKAAKKLKKGEIEAIRKAVEENDEVTIETIHKNVLARIPVGNTADDVAKKLTKKEEPPEPVKPEPDKNDRI